MLRLIKWTVLLSVLVLLAGPVAVVEPGSEGASATLTVTKTADTNDGSCDDDCSLREALAAVLGSLGVILTTYAPELLERGRQRVRPE